MTKKITPTEATESLTGFDEIAIKQRFGTPVGLLGQQDPTQYMRALAFVIYRRDGKPDAEAYQMAQDARIGDLNDMFASPKKKDDPESDFGEQPPTTKP